jgi:hypothetical protein
MSIYKSNNQIELGTYLGMADEVKDNLWLALLKEWRRRSGRDVAKASEQFCHQIGLFENTGFIVLLYEDWCILLL